MVRKVGMPVGAVVLVNYVCCVEVVKRRWLLMFWLLKMREDVDEGKMVGGRNLD